MFGGLVTSALLLAGTLLTPCWSQAGPVQVDATRPRIQAAAATSPGWAVASWSSIPPARHAAISRHLPWKSRRKAVLEESNPQIGDESDLGPAPAPNRPFSVLTVEAPAPPLAASHRLRC